MQAMTGNPDTNRRLRGGPCEAGTDGCEGRLRCVVFELQEWIAKAGKGTELEEGDPGLNYMGGRLYYRKSQ